MRQAITNIFETSEINAEYKQYTDITTKQYIKDFIYNVVINKIYDESTKQYKPLNPKYHYINYYNYFMGLRITQNRVDLSTNSNNNSNRAESRIRKINYSGNTTARYGDLDKTKFGTDEIQYWKSCGYANVGGFVHFFNSSITLNQAQNKFNTMINDGLFSEELLDITLEIMFYNENYQTGITIAYQFLINNAGDVEKYKDTTQFFLSRYSKYYHQSSNEMRWFLIFLDVIYVIFLFIITAKTTLIIKRRFMDIFDYKAFTFKWYEILDVIILALSYSNFVLWIITFLVFESIAAPIEDINIFQEYVDIWNNTKAFWIVSSFLFFLLSIRLFRIITERFHAFGALFETIKVALKDLFNYFIAILILVVGFSIATWIIFGPNLSEFENIWISIVRLFFLQFGDTKTVLTIPSVNQKFLQKLYFIIFVFLFSVVLMKMFITIVIVRYKYLRSITQLDNEANARIFAKKGNAFRKKLINLLWCRRRTLVESNSRKTRNISDNNNAPLWISLYLNFKDLIKKPELQSKCEIEKELNDMK